MRLNDESKTMNLALSALAHPIRRAILQRVMKRERRITELAKPFALSLNAISKHIRILEFAGLVKRRRVWREHLVSFDPAPLDRVALWIEKHRKIWNDRLDALDQLLQDEDTATKNE